MTGVMTRMITAIASALWMLAFTHHAFAKTYYVDFQGGANQNDGHDTAHAWKSHPYMQAAAGCAGSPPSYVHAAGDVFVFKGGVTWPAPCFQMKVAAGGSSPSTRDRYTVDTTWFAGATWTRPTFDLAQQVPTGFPYDVVYFNDQSHVEIDSIEIANQGISAHAGYKTAAAMSAGSGSDIVVMGVYVHDWVTTDTFDNSMGGPDYAQGGFVDALTLTRSTTTGLGNVISDVNGFAYNSTGKRVSVAFGGGCANCSEVAFTHFSHTMAGCFSVSNCHDNEFDDITQAPWDEPTPSGFGLTDVAPVYARPHTQVIENDSGACGNRWYNNLIHDCAPGVVIYGCASDAIFNNVIWNSKTPAILLSAQSAPTGKTGLFLNNTVDCSNGGSCIALDNKGPFGGTLDVENNIWVTNGMPVCFGATGCSSAATIVNSHNYTMSTAEAAMYGFTSATKYAPTSTDGKVVGQGVDLSSSCSGGLAALCFDVEGATWYAGAYVARPMGSAWTLGAYAWPLGVIAPPSDAGTPSDTGVPVGHVAADAGDAAATNADPSYPCPGAGCSCQVGAPSGGPSGISAFLIALVLGRRSSRRRPAARLLAAGMLCACSAPAGSLHEGSDGGEVEASTPDAGALDAAVTPDATPPVNVTPPSSTQIVADFGAAQQIIDGFGASEAFVPTLSDAQADLFFSTTAGIGLSILRLGIAPTGSLYSGSWGTAQKAVARNAGLVVWAAPWSPPASDKTTLKTTTGSINASAYGSWASALASFATNARAAGVPLWGISAQNEPDFDTSGRYDMCLYSAAQMTAFIKVLGPALAALKPPVHVIAPESENWNDLWGGANYAGSITSDATAAGYVGILATHQYGVTTPPKHTVPSGMHLWETEDSDFTSFDPTIASAITLATWLHHAVVEGGVNAWHYWWLIAAGTDNEGLLGKGGALTKRVYAMGNYSRFVRPGWTRLGVTGSLTGILVSAYANLATGDFAIVTVNTSNSTVHGSLGLAGPAFAEVTPYVTSATPLGAIGTDGNLSAGSPSAKIPPTIAASGNAFTADVPPGLVTFVGRAH